MVSYALVLDIYFSKRGFRALIRMRRERLIRKERERKTRKWKGKGQKGESGGVKGERGGGKRKEKRKEKGPASTRRQRPGMPQARRH